MEVEHTPDGRHIIVNGRRWRATDPSIPPERAAALRKELMAARRDVGRALKQQDEVLEHEARARVQLAKVALGERGTPWWEQSMTERRARWESGATGDD